MQEDSNYVAIWFHVILLVSLFYVTVHTNSVADNKQKVKAQKRRFDHSAQLNLIKGICQVFETIGITREVNFGERK